MARGDKPTRDDLDLHFPLGGLHVTQAVSKQPNVHVGPGKSDYSRTTPRAVNVRGRDPSTLRRRGAARAGLSPWLPARPGDVEYVTQELAVVVATGFTPEAGMPQASQSGRVVTVVDVSLGNVYYAYPEGTAWTAATNNTGETPPLNSSGLVFSAADIEKLWFADGTNWCYFDPKTTTVYPWVASAGALPIDDQNNTPRLIAAWRTRILLAGLLRDPATLFGSRVGDPTDFDYSPLSPSSADAFAVAMGDVITSIIPYSDDLCVVGMDGSIKVLRGDPKYGGQVDLVTSSVGVAWGMPWCMDPYGVVYFVSNRMQVYAFDPRSPGNKPQRVSGPIQPLLGLVNTGEQGIRCFWDDRYNGFNVFITTLSTPTATDRHYFYETHEGGAAWWQDRFKNPKHNPLCGCVLDGNRPEDRAVLVGCWDGYVRVIDPDAPDDDGYAIESEVWVGPFLTKFIDEVGLLEVQGVLAEASGDVGYAVLVGQTAEEALESEAVASGTWSAGRNFTDPVRRRGYAAYLRLVSSVRWAFEVARCVIDTAGLVRRRGR